jgi:DNA-binding CsgD family transcriptional regulator
VSVEAHCLLDLAEVALLRGESDAARELLGQVTRCAVALDNAGLTASAKVLLARAARAEGDLDQALELTYQSLVMQRDSGYQLDAVRTLETIAGLWTARNAHLEAARLLTATTTIRRRLGIRRQPRDHLLHGPDLARIIHAVDRATLRNIRRQATTLTLEETIAYATRGRGQKGRATTGWDSLTPTEIAVVRLAADGLTNREIASRMYISGATVKAHLTHIFSKLNLKHRAELAAHATRRFA